MNKNKIVTFFYCFIIIHQLFQTITASQYNPNLFFFTPENDIEGISNASITYSAGFAHQAFNRNSELVPFLQQYGPEDFLQRFVDPSLGPDNLESAGQGHISGKYHFQQYRFFFIQNIHHKLYFGAIIQLQDIAITDIKAKFLSSELPLSPDQTTYLYKLEQIIPKTIHQSGMYSTNLFAGYNETLTHFTHINCFRSLLLVSVATPQAMSHENRSIFQYPCAANYHFGYPVLGAITIGVNDFFSFGFCGLVIPMQPVNITIPINKTGENNHLLFSQTTQARVDQKPFFSGTMYLEIKDRFSKYSGMFAYSYTQFLRSIITPDDTSEFSIAHSNRSILNDGFSMGSFLLQFNINCTSEEKKLAPIVSMFFSMPIAGNLIQKTYLFGGACNFAISYDF